MEVILSKILNREIILFKKEKIGNVFSSFV